MKSTASDLQLGADLHKFQNESTKNQPRINLQHALQPASWNFGAGNSQRKPGERCELLAHRGGGREAAASFLLKFRNSDIQPTTINLCWSDDLRAQCHLLK